MSWGSGFTWNKTDYSDAWTKDWQLNASVVCRHIASKLGPKCKWQGIIIHTSLNIGQTYGNYERVCKVQNGLEWMRIHGLGIGDIGEVPIGANSGGVEAVGGDRGRSGGELDGCMVHG